MGFNKLTREIGGHPMVWYAVRNLREAGLHRILVVVGHDRGAVKQAIGEDVEWIVQDEQLGTGHAAAQLIPFLRDEKHVVILFGDCPFIDADTIKEALDTHFLTHAELTLATARLRDPRSLGLVQRDPKGFVERVVEAREVQNVGFWSGRAEVFAGLSIWQRSAMETVLPQLTLKSKGEGTSEQDLPEAVEIIRASGGIISTYPDVPEDDALGPNVPIDFERASEYLRSKVRARLMAHGVRLPDPEHVFIDFDVSVEEGSSIHAGTYLLGSTRIGRNCEVGPDTILRDCVVESNSLIERGSWTKQIFPEGTRARDRLGGDHIYFRQPHFMIPEEPWACFGIIPFREPYLDIWNNAILPTLKTQGFQARLSSQPGVGIVIDEIWQEINRSGLIVAEISSDNPNVWYELGLAHALNKPVVMLLQHSKRRRKIPFDVQQHRILIYDSSKHNLSPLLAEWLDDFKARRSE